MKKLLLVACMTLGSINLDATPQQKSTKNSTASIVSTFKEYMPAISMFTILTAPVAYCLYKQENPTKLIIGEIVGTLGLFFQQNAKHMYHTLADQTARETFIKENAPETVHKTIYTNNQKRSNPATGSPKISTIRNIWMLIQNPYVIGGSLIAATAAVALIVANQTTTTDHSKE